MKRHEVAELFSVSASTVDRWARAGLLGAAVLRTPGGRYRYKRAEIQARAGQTGWSEFSSLTDD